MTVKSRIASFTYAFKGIRDLFTSQPNAKIHAAVAGLCIVAAWYFQLSQTEWCFILFAIFSVLAAEAFNTGLEHLTDLVSPDFHELAGRTKDVAAAGVLLMAMGAATVGLIIFLPKIYALFSSM